MRLDHTEAKDFFERMIWSRLKEKEKKELLLRFGTHGVVADAESTDFREHFDKGLPCPFVIAAMRKADIFDHNVFEACECDEEMLYLLSYEEDGWGALLRHSPLGLVDHDDLPQSENVKLERLIKSSINLSIHEKTLLLSSIQELDGGQVRQLIEMFHKEMITIHKRFMLNGPDGVRDLVEKIEKNKNEWERMEKTVITAVQNGRNAVELDHAGDPKPAALVQQVGQYVKGQEEALRSLAIPFYYQMKVAKAIAAGRTPSYRIDPILVVGETGHGKSYSIKKFCEATQLPYIHVDASSMVRTGIRGTSVDDLLKNIIRRAGYDLDKAQSAVVVLDEFDKLLFGAQDDVYNTTVLNQLLRFIEGGEFPIEKGTSEEYKEFDKISFIDTTHMFFVLSGSFQHFRDDATTSAGFVAPKDVDRHGYTEIVEKSGLPKELLGRVKEIVVLRSLDAEAMLEILKGPGSPIEKYRAMLKESGGLAISLDEAALLEIAKEAAADPYGARALDRLVYERFKEALFTGSKKVFTPRSHLVSILQNS